jgi:PAS domain S-box-containing protein
VDEPSTRIVEPVRDAARFAELIDDLEAVVWEYEVGTGRYTYMSAAVERILGFAPQEWLADPTLLRRICHPDDLVAVSDFYRRIESEQGRGRIEYRTIAADGREVWTRDIAHVVDPGDGGPCVVRGVCLDVTERKLAERAAAETQARYRSLVEQISAITYVWTAGGDPSEDPRTYVSPQIERMLGFSPSEWLIDAELWRRRIHPEDADRVLAENDRCNETGGPFCAEYRLIARDGREVWVREEANVIDVDSRGAPHLWQGVMFDVTERRRIEKERSTLLVRLVQAQEEERRRIGGEIHDDSVQKMTAVGIRLESLRKRIGDPEVSGAVDELHKSVRLSIARLRHLLFELRPPSLDRDGLAAALREYLEDAGREGGFGHSLHNGLGHEPPIEVRTIAYRIAQEALTNVRKHARAYRVSVRLEMRDGGFATRIEDDGVGFTHGAGNGRPGHRGLATMRERAELGGGWLRVDTGGPGTTVEFWLPYDANRAVARA